MKRILIIEDDQQIAEFEKDYLEASQYDVEVCHTGSAGLLEAKQEKYDLIIYTLLRSSFRTTLLSLMEMRIGKPFKKTKAYIYKNCPNGFYVYAKPALSNPKEVIKYIARYLGRPVIATSRIDHTIVCGHSIYR